MNCLSAKFSNTWLDIYTYSYSHWRLFDSPPNL